MSRPRTPNTLLNLGYVAVLGKTASGLSVTKFGALPNSTQDDDTVLSPGKREVARAEAERLKQQAKQKKEMLDRMREQQNHMATMGDVGGA